MMITQESQSHVETGKSLSNGVMASDNPPLNDTGLQASDRPSAGRDNTPEIDAKPDHTTISEQASCFDAMDDDDDDCQIIDSPTTTSPSAPSTSRKRPMNHVDDQRSTSVGLPHRGASRDPSESPRKRAAYERHVSMPADAREMPSTRAIMIALEDSDADVGTSASTKNPHAQQAKSGALNQRESDMAAIIDELNDELASVTEDLKIARGELWKSRNRNITLLAEEKMVKEDKDRFVKEFTEKWKGVRIKELEQKHERDIGRMQVKVDKACRELREVKSSSKETIKSAKAECDEKVKDAKPETSRIIKAKDAELKTKATRIKSLQFELDALKKANHTIAEDKRQVELMNHDLRKNLNVGRMDYEILKGRFEKSRIQHEKAVTELENIQSEHLLEVDDLKKRHKVKLEDSMMELKQKYEGELKQSKATAAKQYDIAQHHARESIQYHRALTLSRQALMRTKHGHYAATVTAMDNIISLKHSPPPRDDLLTTSVHGSIRDVDYVTPNKPKLIETNGTANGAKLTAGSQDLESGNIATVIQFDQQQHDMTSQAYDDRDHAEDMPGNEINVN